jgi:hypothetical protein
MNRDLEALSLIQELSADEFERFRKAAHILTSKTFIIRGIGKERELYDFTVRNIALFDAWFSCMDSSLVRDENLGVIAFRGSGLIRMHFTREEICAVLALRLLYEDKKLEVSLTSFPVVSVADFQQKYNAMTGDEIRKTALINVLRRLSSCKLVAIDSQDYADPETLIQLYPSILMSIDRNALDEAMAFLEEKNGPNAKGLTEDSAESFVAGSGDSAEGSVEDR